MEVITGRIQRITNVDPDSGRQFDYSVKVQRIDGASGTRALVAMTDVATKLEVGEIYTLSIETVRVGPESAIFNDYIRKSVRQ